MNNVLKAICFLSSLLVASSAWADGSSPSPTTSPSSSRSGTLIQTDVFPDDHKLPIFKKEQLVISKKPDLAKYKKARSALRREIAQFGNLSKKAQKSLSPALKKALRSSLQKISRHAKTIQAISRKGKNKTGMGIATQILINDDITGKILINDDITGSQPIFSKAAKRLRNLEANLGLVEPVVYR